MAFCSNCGTFVPDSEDTCKICGWHVPPIGDQQGRNAGQAQGTPIWQVPPASAQQGQQDGAGQAQDGPWPPPPGGGQQKQRQDAGQAQDGPWPPPPGGGQQNQQRGAGQAQGGPGWQAPPHGGQQNQQRGAGQAQGGPGWQAPPHGGPQNQQRGAGQAQGGPGWQAPPGGNQQNQQRGAGQAQGGPGWQAPPGGNQQNQQRGAGQAQGGPGWQAHSGQRHNTSGGSFSQGFTHMASNANDYTMYMDPADINANKVYGGLAYLLFFIPLIACPHSKYGRFHANQALLLVLLAIFCNVASGMSGMITFILAPLVFITELVSAALRLVSFVFWIIGVVNGFTGRAKELPLIGKFRIIK